MAKIIEIECEPINTLSTHEIVVENLCDVDAKRFALEAQEAAIAAKESEDNAKVSEDNAKESETNAKESETIAVQAATEATEALEAIQEIDERFFVDRLHSWEDPISYLGKAVKGTPTSATTWEIWKIRDGFAPLKAVGAWDNRQNLNYQ